MTLFSEILAYETLPPKSELLLRFISVAGYAQTDNTALLSTFENYQLDFPSEHVFLRFDQRGYTSGDTACFKAYVLGDRAHWPLSKSARLYVEFLNDSR